MSRAVVVAMHKYTPFGSEFYEPLLDFFIHNLSTYAQGEFDHLYIVDSNWDIDLKYDTKGIPTTVMKVSPHLRYYDAYKEVLPHIQEDLILFMDNDMIVYRKGVIKNTFDLLDANNPDAVGVVSIYDTIGEKTFPQLNNKSKFCPYWFATSKNALLYFKDHDWGSHMPQYETLGLLTEKMLHAGIKPYEWEEDKSNILFDGTKDGEKSKDLGYYHIRAGSTPAYLLATRSYGDKKTYWDYLNNQPKNEYLRQCAWYEYMLKDIDPQFLLMLIDMKVSAEAFYLYKHEFKKYHNLP